MCNHFNSDRFRSDNRDHHHGDSHRQCNEFGRESEARHHRRSCLFCRRRNQHFCED